jgi:glutathione peroxidase
MLSFFVKLFAVGGLVLAACGSNTNPQNTMSTNTATSSKSFYEFSLKALNSEQEIDFSQFKGKKVLLVNVASKCGYTPQYAKLQALHETHGDKVVVIGVPANNFGGQEPGSQEDIAAFCQKNYGVSFQMLEKISVKGKDQHPLYGWLTEQTGKEPSWNFCKYLIDENGKAVAFFASGADPMGKEILSAIGAQ